MDSIYKLQQRAASLRAKTQTDSITPEEVGGLQYDTLAYLADMERNLDGLGIRKVYLSINAMEADIAPIGTNGKALRLGQLVTIYNASAPTADGTGNVYAYQNPGWLPVGNIGGIYELKEQIEAEVAEREDADIQLELRLSFLSNSITSLSAELGTLKINVNNINARLGTLSDAYSEFNASVGKAGGIAPLDSDGKVASRYLPGYVDDVVRFDGFVKEAEIAMLPVETPEGIYYVKSAGLFAARSGEVYVNNWPDADRYLDGTRSSVLKDKAYLCDGNLYVWDDTAEGLVLSCQNRCVAVEDMGSFFSEDVKGVFNGVKGGLWKVMKENICVGTLEVFGDNNRHCITEVLTTNFTVDDDGGIGNGHQHTVRQYYRMYNVRWSAAVLNDGVTPWPVGTWSAWTECDREALDAAYDAVRKAEENAAAIADNEASIAENASAIACNKLGCTVRFDGFVEEAEIGMLSVETPEGIYYVKSAGLFAARSGEVYVNNWPDADRYLDGTRSSVLKDKAYLCDGNLYVWDDTAEGLVLSCQNRCVAVEDMGSFFSEDVKGVFNGVKGGLWKVMKENICVGTLEVFGDNNRHCITEVLTTNFTVDDDGGIGNGHQHTVRQYYRMYNVRWSSQVLMDGETPWPLNTWSAWTSCDREALDAARAYTLEAAVPRTFINASRLLGISEAKSLDAVTNLLSERGYGTPDWIGLGTVITFLSEDGWKNYRYLVEDASGGLTKAENWQEFGSGNAAVGNIYNVTNEQPIQGYYDLETAVAATFENGFAKQGVQITFAIARGSWKT